MEGRSDWTGSPPGPHGSGVRLWRLSRFHPGSHGGGYSGGEFPAGFRPA